MYSIVEVLKLESDSDSAKFTYLYKLCLVYFGYTDNPWIGKNRGLQC